MVDAVAHVRDPAERALHVLALEAEVALAHDHHLAALQHAVLPQPQDVPLDEPELLLDLLLATPSAPAARALKIAQTLGTRTLQPPSTSMPSTCAPQTVSNSAFRPKKKQCHDTKLHNAVLCLSHDSYHKVLRSLVEESVASIHSHFFAGRSMPEIDRLRDVVANASHVSLCAVFFLLLNVDADLKNKIVSMDSDANAHKMARFLLDLRGVLAVRFFTDETCTPMLFVEACVDCYILS